MSNHIHIHIENKRTKDLKTKDDMFNFPFFKKHSKEECYLRFLKDIASYKGTFMEGSVEPSRKEFERRYAEFERQDKAYPYKAAHP